MVTFQSTEDARQCHALRVRLGAPARVEVPWVERVPFASEDPGAARHRERELARPVDAGRGSRAVLIEYTDGQADLVVVAHRAAFDQRALRRLVAAVRDGAGAAPPDGTRDPLADFDHAPAWGLGDKRLGDASAGHRTALPDGTSGEPAGWLEALDVVLTRYEPERETEVAALDTGEPADLLPAAAVSAGLIFDLGGEGSTCRAWRPSSR